MPAHVCAKVWATGHQHDGALGMELWLNGSEIFETAPSYGSEEGVPGNELVFHRSVTQIGSSSEPVPIADGSRAQRRVQVRLATRRRSTSAASFPELKWHGRA